MDWEKWREIAEKNGVTKDRFRQRVKSGWTPEEAATTPPLKPGDPTPRREKARWNKPIIFTKNAIQTAKRGRK
jgi:hypothetical protein